MPPPEPATHLRHPPASTAASRRRTPAGALSRRPIALRLHPEELGRLIASAEVEQRTNAAFARLCFLHGLAAYERDPAALLAR